MGWFDRQGKEFRFTYSRLEDGEDIVERQHQGVTLWWLGRTRPDQVMVDRNRVERSGRG